MNDSDQRHEEAEMGCFIRTLAYVIVSIFGIGFLAGAALVIAMI